MLLPDSTNWSLLTRWMVFLESFTESNDPFVVCGDTNINILKENKFTKNSKEIAKIAKKEQKK